MLGQTHLLQDTHADLLFLPQRVSHKPHDAPSLAQQRLLANPLGWLAYKRLPDPPWKHFAKRKVRCHSQTGCKIHMQICSFWFKGCPTNHMMHQALCSKGYLLIRLAGWPTRGCQTLPGNILRSTEHARTNTLAARYPYRFALFASKGVPQTT